MHSHTIRTVPWRASRPTFALFALALYLLALSVVAVAAPPVENFTFIHISDEHIYHFGTPETIAELATLGRVQLTPYNFTALPPSFVIETGDMTEFGPKAGAWNALNKCYENVTLQRYMLLGNHDGTWRSLSYELRQLYGKPYYSFDKFGCHFVVLDSAGMQDPRPTLGPEQIEWLKKDLEKIDPDTPLFVAVHHPLDTTEFASRYEADRLMDVLRPFNLVALLVGHSHGYKDVVFDGADMVYGGSAWGPALAGYQVVSVTDGTLRIAYKERGKPDAATATLTKSIAPPAKRYPSISIDAPIDHVAYRAQVPVKAWVRLGPADVKSAYAEIDAAKKKIELRRSPGGSFDAVITAADLAPGAHYMRVSFETPDGAAYHKSCSFYVETDKPAVRWRALMDSASKSTPTVAGDKVFVGGYDGVLRAYEVSTGAPTWQFVTAGAIVCEPLALGDKLYFTSEDRKLYCVRQSDGSKVWHFEADEPIYSTPVTDGSAIYFGSGSGAFYSINPHNGSQNWKNTEGAYNIESKPFVADGRVYYGCWDTYVYCLNTSDGSLVWKCVGQGSAEGTAPAYYAPADCGPVVAGGKVFAPDRKYRMSVIDAATGKLLSFVDKVSGVGLAPDGSHIYLRKTDGNLVKTELGGKEIWSAAVSMDEVPTAPVETNGVVYVSSKRGMVSAVSASDGKIVWQYQATPSSYILSSVGVSGSGAFISGTDGSLTAVGR